MALVSFDSVSLEYGDTPLLADADFQIEEGERVCIIGRNGTGKSSMMKIMTREVQPDSGIVRFDKELVVSSLKQELPDELGLTVRDFVATALSDLQAMVDEYESLSANQGNDKSSRLTVLEKKLDIGDGWRLSSRVDAILADLSLPGDETLGTLSGGWRRRASLARSLVLRPNLLLLDEPTNHLDLSAIRWLEDKILAFNGSVAFITHDRAFLRRLATRIVELDLGQVTSWPGNYDRYLRLKEKSLEDEARDYERHDKRLADEEKWVRQGIKARRTRNEGRVRALVKLRAEKRARLTRAGTVNLSISEADKSSRRVVAARNIHYSIDGRELLGGLDINIRRGDRIGIIGNNGVGKSTLLGVLLGEIEPESGTIKGGQGVETAYFEQTKRNLDLKQTVAVAVGGGSDIVTVDGKDRHIISYLKSFLFSPARAASPLSSLSGGELNRVVLANLFLKPVNLLVLDEPTNDLDVETLEILEEKLVSFTGTLIVVSHDRVFLDNVVTSILVFESSGSIEEYVGGYSDWEKRKKTLATDDARDRQEQKANREKLSGESKNKNTREALPPKLTYSEQLELEKLPDEIDATEIALNELKGKISEPGFYTQEQGETAATLNQLKAREGELETLTARWVLLEEIRETYEKATR